MEKWYIKNRPGDVDKIAEYFKIPRFTATLLINRNLNTERDIDSFINPSLDRLHDPNLLKDIDKASSILKEDIESKNHIRIVGDYDVDGVISSYMLYTSINGLGGNIDYMIPDRVNDGYGINKKIIKKAYDDGVNTIITCDNGIAAIEEIRYAKELGLKVIVTDHHDLPFEMIEDKMTITYVEADAIVNPKRDDCKYPFEKLCGAGVVYKLIQRLYMDFDLPSKEVEKFLEYAAIATICDVVDLVDENRIIVKEGLERLNRTDNLGLKALIKETDLIDTEIGVYHVGFIIGPSINASGRLENAMMALEMLLEDDGERAAALAKDLRILNDERKDMTQDGTEKIIDRIEKSSLKEDTVLVIYEPSIHESVAGIIAGRIKDKYHKPTIVLTDGKEGVKGSARSIEGYNIFEELTKCKELLNRFGGHPMAAGLSLNEEDIGKLREDLNINNLTEEDLLPRIYMDLPLGLDKISYRLIEEIDKLAPYGKGNARPIFGAKGIKLLNGAILGENRNVLKLTLFEEGTTIEGMIFNGVEDFEEMISNEYGEHILDDLYNGNENPIELDMVYYPSINEFRGRTTLQSIIQSYRISN